MNGFFQLLIAWGVLLVFVLMLYMIDKLNFVFSGFSQSDLPETYTDGLFGELYGKPLWDAMSGLPIPGIDKKLVENLKPHYEPVLRQHIEQVFMEGYHHAREGTLGVPSNNRMIPTPRGALESWLPLHHLTSIYEAGSEFFTKPDADVMRIQQNLDQITSMLYARVGISLLDPYSRSLLIHPVGVVRPHADSLVPSPDSGATPSVISTPAANTTVNPAVNPAPVAQPQVKPEANAEIKADASAPVSAPLSAAPAATGYMGSMGASSPAESMKANETVAPNISESEEGVLLQPNLGNLNLETANTVKTPN
jgi:hypothetical protein